ncbi:MAG: D-alanine--D-alanine ligase [Verrucomicrobiae bacterium]|nr:D-alanine--D-alanine ligase [Verrucomicrobiae bacterium]
MKDIIITVLYGGKSAEREISIKSGMAVARALRSIGYTVLEVDPVDDDWVIPSGTDVVFLALHGTFGEDGTIQQKLEELGVSYTGCGPEASRIGFDKAETKKRCIENSIPTARFMTVSSVDSPPPCGFNYPLVIKPVRQGSSVGLQIVEKPSDWQSALIKSFEFDCAVIVEEFVMGREVTVPVLGDEAFPIVEIRPKSGRYDYSSKYTVGATEYICPAEFDAETTKRIQNIALQTFKAIGGRDYARVDIIVRNDGVPVVLEINTLPGMTETSLFPKSAAAKGISYPRLCEMMVEFAMRRTGIGKSGSMKRFM